MKDNENKSAHMHQGGGDREGASGWHRCISCHKNFVDLLKCSKGEHTEFD